MRRITAMLLCAALCLGLAACGLAPPASAPSAAPPNRAFSLTVHQTRLAALRAGDDMLVWACTLELSLLKNAGTDPGGSYEGRLMVSWERDCYLNGAYAVSPAALPGYDPALRRYAWSAPFSLEIQAAGGAGSNNENDALAAALAQDAAAQAALFGAGDEADAGGEISAVTLGEVDDFGNPLPATKPGDAEWTSTVAWVDWESRWLPPNWSDFAAEAVPFAEAAGVDSFTPALPALDQGSFGGAPPSADALPLWLDITKDGVVYVWLPGLMPLEGARPFEGKLHTGGFTPAGTPSPPGAYDPPDPEAVDGADGQQGSPNNAPAKPPDDSPYRNWLAGPAPAGGEGEGEVSSDAQASTGPVTEQPPPKADPLAEALAEYHLPMPNAEITGPKEKDGTYLYNIAGFTYRDACSYARKLKMGGYKTVYSEAEQPTLDLYSLVVGSSGRRLSLRYEFGKTQITIF
ncbi:hypothetical protein LJC60_01520 [Ruminococcaceae bacterium OttesenSCG-928-D13]|nr:hypothetical protein [Ruminococcaceae bacterium OttesenSCG-928-D13]